MNFKDVGEKLKRKNQILFSRESECLQELLGLIRKTDQRVMILWAFECMKAPLQRLKEKYPEDNRAETAVVLSAEWARGKVKMPVAKKAILDCHAAAKEIADPCDIALYHAVGQGCGTVHVITHAIGLPIYELTAIVREKGIDSAETALEEKIEFYIKTLKECEKRFNSQEFEWADFLKKEKPNLEQKIYEKTSRLN